MLSNQKSSKSQKWNPLSITFACRKRSPLKVVDASFTSEVQIWSPYTPLESKWNEPAYKRIRIWYVRTRMKWKLKLYTVITKSNKFLCKQILFYCNSMVRTRIVMTGRCAFEILTNRIWNLIKFQRLTLYSHKISL